MNEGKTPAPWFVEVDGQKQGPYTSQQIMKLLMDGALKVESRIFDTEAGLWKIAADVIPYLDLNVRESENKKSWQPPPKPSELRDVHVAELKEGKSGEVDYFALINDSRKTFEKNRAATTLSLVRAQSARLAAEAKLRTQSNQAATTAEGRGNLPDFRKAALVSNDEMPPKRGHQSALSTSIKPGADGLLSVEEESGLSGSNVLAFTRRVQNFILENKSPISIAAGLCFVFVGTYGVVRTLSGNNGREPANIQQNAVAELNPTANLLPAKGRPTKITMDSGDALGSGQHKIKHGALHAIHQMTAANTPPTPQPTPQTPNDSNQAPRDPPVFYSSSSDPASGTASTPISPQGDTAQIPQPSPQPENTAVQPPAFAQAPQQNEGNDPNRNPADIQQQQQPQQLPQLPQGQSY